MRTVKELTLDARVENISEVTAFIDAELERLDCPLKAQTQIDIAIDELFSNIAFYAYAPNVGLATVRFAYDQQSGMVSITFLDHGIPYDPLEKTDPDTSLAAENRSVGGLGIFLVKKTRDEIQYQRCNDQNVLTIKKRIKT